MHDIEIRRGLRKLDFGDTPAGSHDRTRRVVVEFEVGDRLAREQVVSINLGLRDGIVRELRGRPKLIHEMGSQPNAYLYRLEGELA